MERGNDKWQQTGARRADRYEQTADKKKSFTITENWHKGVPYNYFKETKPKQVGSIKDGGQGNRIYSQDGKSSTLSSQSGGTAGVGNTLVKTKPKQVGKLIEQVKVRKHEVDIPKLQTCILDHYAKCGKDKREIAKELNDKYSTVEHYFRKLGSDFFSIPSEEHWPQLKKILGIETNKFDKQIMEFEFRDGVFETKQRVYSDEGKSPTLTHGSADKLIQVGVAADINGHDILKRVYSPEGKGPTLSTCGGGNTEPKVAQENLTWRKLTPLECERLQTVPDNYTEGVSNTQRYKMLGNGWTVEVIKHILGDIK